MIFSIQLLGFNKDNSSESLLNNMTPTSEDKITYIKLYSRHEQYLEDENEGNEMFGLLAMDFDDVEMMCNISIDESAFNKANTDCDLFNYGDGFGLNKTNSESFEFLLNMFDEFGYAVSFIDENFKLQDIEDIKELIKQKQQKSLPVVFSYFFYALE